MGGPNSDPVTTERQGTHWEGCWRAHHECAINLLDKIFREETVGPDQARRLLAEAKAALAGRSDVNGPDGSWCDYCTPRKLYHPTDHPEQESGEV